MKKCFSSLGCLFGAVTCTSICADLVQLPTADAFNELIKNDKVVALFVFPPGKPCQNTLAAAAKVAKDQKDVTFVAVDIRTYGNLKNLYHVDKLPTIILFSNGVEVTRTTGQRNASSLKMFMDKAFNGRGKTFLKSPVAYTVSWIKSHFTNHPVNDGE